MPATEKKSNMKIRITDLQQIHGDNYKDKFQVFLSDDGRVVSSMVLSTDLLVELYMQIGRTQLTIDLSEEIEKARKHIDDKQREKLR